MAWSFAGSSEMEHQASSEHFGWRVALRDQCRKEKLMRPQSLCLSICGCPAAERHDSADYSVHEDSCTRSVTLSPCLPHTDRSSIAVLRIASAAHLGDLLCCSSISSTAKGSQWRIAHNNRASAFSNEYQIQHHEEGERKGFLFGMFRSFQRQLLGSIKRLSDQL